MDITKWEYKHEGTSDIERLNKLGAQGWEAVAVGGATHCFVILKRPCGKIQVQEVKQESLQKNISSEYEGY